MRGGPVSSRATTGGVRRRATAAACVAMMLALAACEADGSNPEPAPSPSATPDDPVKLTLGVNGTEDELAAYTAVAEIFDSLYDPAEVEVENWDSSADMMSAIRDGEDVPDVFLVNRDDLATLQEENLTQPVDALLDARGVDFGDGYSRDALQAFSADDRLQCMPYGISPMVIYYNTELVDFDRMEKRGLLVPEEREAWTFEMFTAAAQFASRRGANGVYIEPGVRTLAPFIYSGGGQVFDDEDAPTSLALSDGDSVEAMERTLEVLRRPQLSLSEKQVAERSPLQWFKRGELGMMAGYRRLVPELRQTQGLDFDVISMPILDGLATTGDITGLCLSADAASTPAAADLMVQLLGTPAVERVVRAGYLVPANSQVALSEEFLQPGRLPEHSSVFNNSVRAIQIPPLLSVWSELEEAVAPELDQLVQVPVLDDLEERLADIDEQSRPVLESDSATPSEE
jgi:multiple sugar transport system substrate-binding protein